MKLTRLGEFQQVALDHKPFPDKTPINLLVCYGQQPQLENSILISLRLKNNTLQHMDPNPSN